MKVEKSRPKDMGLLLVVGGPGASGSSTIAKMLARYFGLHYIYGGKFMRDYAKKYGYASIEDYLASKEGDEDWDEIDRLVDNKLISASRWHDVLIDSKTFAALVTFMQIPCNSRIWLTASLDTRVKRSISKLDRSKVSHKISKSSKLYKQIESSLIQRYELDKQRFNELYGIDYNNPEKYNDIVLDTSALDEGQTFYKILERLKEYGIAKPD